MTEKRLTMPAVVAYLRGRGIPKNTVEAIRVAILEDAVIEAKDIRYERIYTSVALAARRAYGFGPHKIFDLLMAVDKIFNDVADEPGKYWDDVMAELDRETGIVIRSGDSDDRLICEYQGRTVKRAKEIKEQEEKTKNASDEVDL